MKEAKTAIVNGNVYRIIGHLNKAPVIRRLSGAKKYLAFPVNDGRDSIYGSCRYRIVRPLFAGEDYQEMEGADQ